MDWYCSFDLRKGLPVIPVYLWSYEKSFEMFICLCQTWIALTLPWEVDMMLNKIQLLTD